MKAKEATEATKPSPLALTAEQTQRIVQSVQQRDFAQQQAQIAQLNVVNAVQAVALELRVDPELYDLTVVQNEAGQLVFKPKETK